MTKYLNSVVYVTIAVIGTIRIFLRRHDGVLSLASKLKCGYYAKNIKYIMIRKLRNTLYRLYYNYTKKYKIYFYTHYKAELRSFTYVNSGQSITKLF